MSSQHSSTVTDLAFSNHTERGLNLKGSGICCFLRFRDDVFFIAENRDAAEQIIAHLTAAARP